MAARYDDPVLRRQVLRMLEGGLTWRAVRRLTGLSLDTIGLYVRGKEGDRFYACPGCGTRSDHPEGHARCRVAA